jgi:hypothetical protein
MTEVPRVDYRAKSLATPGMPARLAALRFVLDCHAKKRGRLLEKSGPDDPERRSDEIRAKTSIP